MPSYRNSVMDEQGLVTEFYIDLKTRKIRFIYDVSPDKMHFDFGLLSEVGERWQATYREMLAQDHITLEISDTPAEYCNLVTRDSFPADVWED